MATRALYIVLFLMFVAFFTETVISADSNPRITAGSFTKPTCAVNKYGGKDKVSIKQVGQDHCSYFKR